MPASPFTSPPVPPPQPVILPPVYERVLANGVRVVVASRGGVPRTEVRANLPVGWGPDADVATTTLVGRVLLSGTRGPGGPVAQALARVGATLAASADVDAIRLSGGGLSDDLPTLLRSMAHVVATPDFDDESVLRERDRLAHEVEGARRRSQIAGAEALLDRLYGHHPYARVLPRPEDIAAAGPEGVRRFLAERVNPGGASVVIVGSAEADLLLDAAEEALGGWPKVALEALEPPAPIPAGPATVRLVDRPGAVQTLALLGGRAPGLGQPGDAPLQVAAALLGGYGSCRLAQNLRVRRGFAYGVETSIQRRLLSSHVVTSVAVAAAVTGPTLVELRYELGRLATETVDASELGGAQRHLCGNLSRSTQTKAGLASLLAGLAGAGLQSGFLTNLTADLEAVSAADVLAAARRHLAPTTLQAVVVGDGDRIRVAVEALETVGSDVA